MFLVNERNEKIREECKVLELIEEYFKKEYIVIREWDMIGFFLYCFYNIFKIKFVLWYMV